jgi:hypothetical protein
MLRYSTLCLVLLFTGSPSLSRASSLLPDSAMEVIYADLRIKTEHLFEAQKDSFSYESDNSATKEFNEHYIYSIVRIGNLFSKYDRHALIAYSLNDTTLFVEIRQQIGKIWVRRFRNTSYTSRLSPPFSSPISIKDLNGDGVNDLFIADVFLAMPGTELKGNAWINTHDGLQKIQGFDQIPNAEYDSGTKQYVGHVSCSGGMIMTFLAYELKKNYELREVKKIECDCSDQKTEGCKVTTDKLKIQTVPRNEAYRYVLPYYSKLVKDQFSSQH